MVRTIKPCGPLNGLLGGRFILAFLACIFLGLSKGIAIGYIVFQVIGGYDPPGPSVIQVVGSLSALFIPQLFLAILSTTGFSFKSMKKIFYHIELLILPSGK